MIGSVLTMASRHSRPMEKIAMSKLVLMATFTALSTTAALSQTAVPDLRGTWKGDSETIILGGGNAHHSSTASSAPRFNSFTLTIDKQEGRLLRDVLLVSGQRDGDRRHFPV